MSASIASAAAVGLSAGVYASVSAEQDWINLRSGAGVIKWIDFEDPANVSNYTHATSTAGNVQWMPGGPRGKGVMRIWSLAADAEDSGAWRWPIGNWSSNSDGPGVGADNYVRFRFRFGRNRFVAANANPGQTVQGFKVCNLAGYDIVSPNSSHSHTSDEIVVAQKGELSRAPWPYRDDESSGLPGSQSSHGFSEDDGSGGFYLQNAVDNGAGISDPNARFCKYDPTQIDAMSVGCWRWEEDVWYTIQIYWKNASPNGISGNRFVMWVASEFDGAYTKLCDHTDFSFGYDPTYNPAGIRGLWFPVYTTGRASGNADTYHEFDEVISSSQFIPCHQARQLPSFVSPTLFDWSEIPNSALASVSVTNPGGTVANRLDAWNGFALDEDTSEEHQTDTGGHTDYAGNESNKLPLEGTAQWTPERGPTPAASVQDSSYYLDNRPASRHTYYGEMFDRWTRRVLIISGARWQGGQFTSQFDGFDVESQDYLNPGTYPDLPGQVSNFGSYSAVVFCMDPRNGTIYAMGNFNLYKIARPYTAWVNSAPTSFGGGESVMRSFQRAASAFDTRRNRILVVGGDSNPGHHHYAPDTGVLAAVTFTGAQAATVASAVDAGLTYLPNEDAFMLCLGGSGAPLIRIDAETFDCTSQATTGGSGIPASLHGPFTRIKHVPRLKGILYSPRHDSNAYFLRTGT